MVSIIDTQLAEVTITSRLEQYNSNNVTVLIDLDYSLTPQDLIVYNSLYSSSFQVVSVPPVEIEIVGQRSVQIHVLYNTFYNVSVTGPCAMNSILLFFGKFLYLNSIAVDLELGSRLHEHKFNAHN